MKWLRALIVVALCAVPVGASAWWQSIQQVGVAGGAPFTGPLDCAGCANPATDIALWSLRCASATYSGNVADVYAPSDASHTLITCSTGGVLNETLQALSTTCATSCTIKTLYDQSGLNSCFGSVACNLTQATEASRPSFTTSCVNGKYCGVCTGGAVLVSAGIGVAAVPQPFMVSYVGEQTSTTLGTLLASNDTASQFGFSNNTAWLFASTAVVTATAANNAWHSVQGTLNGASSELYVDGAATTGLNPGTAGWTFNQPFDICSAAGGNPFTGNFTEVSVWSGTWTTGQKSGMTTNQRNYWNF